MLRANLPPQRVVLHDRSVSHRPGPALDL